MLSRYQLSSVWRSWLFLGRLIGTDGVVRRRRRKGNDLRNKHVVDGASLLQLPGISWIRHVAAGGFSGQN